MEFLIERTSMWEEEKPIDDERLYYKKYTRIDTRTVDDPQKLPRSVGDSWYDKGSSHKVNDRGCITREFPDSQPGWFIKLNSLEELMAFIDGVGHEVVIGYSMWNLNVPSIEIYDTYRE